MKAYKELYEELDMSFCLEKLMEDKEQFKARFKVALDEFFNEGKAFSQEFADYIDTKEGLAETFRLLNLKMQKALEMLKEARNLIE